MQHFQFLVSLTLFQGKKKKTSAEVPKSLTPAAKPSTAVSKSRTPQSLVEKHPQSKPQTPVGGAASKPEQDAKLTPGSAKHLHRWEKRVFSPSVAARSSTLADKPTTPKNVQTSLNKASPLSRVGVKRKQTDTVSLITKFMQNLI